MARFFTEIGQGMIATIRGRNFWWHILAIALTAILVISGFDWWFFSVTRGNLANMLGISAGLSGFVVPIIIPLIIFIWGYVSNDELLTQAGVKAFQAVAVAFLITVVYKIFTGRIQPEFLANLATIDLSHGFQFGIWRNGIFWGWPSSHAASSFGLASYLTLRFRKHKLVGTLAIIYALFVATGAAMSFHWFSDVIAGIIVGCLAGYVVYRQTSGLDKCDTISK